MPLSLPGMKVAVIAFGTRGDVQPLVVLAAGIVTRCTWCSEVVFLTHQLHAGFVDSLLKLGSAERCDGLTKPKLATVDSPPVLWKGSSGSDAIEARANLAQQDGCMEACRGAGLVIFNMFALEAFHVSEANNIPCVVCHPYLTTATPMPSSFAAKMRRTYPHLYRRLTRLPDRPILSPKPVWGGSATGADSGSREEATDTNGGREETAWAHVEHWMWPLFTDRWGAFRERLGLHPCPFHEQQSMEPLEGRTVEEGSCSSVPGNGAGDALTAVDPSQLPLVLYLFSALVVDASPFWPDCVRVCGYLFPTPAPTPTPPTTAQPKSVLEPASSFDSQGQRPAQSSADQRHQVDPNLARSSDRPENDVGFDVDDKSRACSTRGNASSLPPNVKRFLAAREDRPIYVGFGSMWSMCSPGYRLAFALRVLMLGVRQAGSRCMVHLPTREAAGVGKGGFEGAETGDGSRLAELDSAMDWVLGEFAAAAAQDDLLVFQGPVAHDLLLPRCSVAIHHGGSGTTAAALRAGIPQVVCPQQLDQFFWAERVRHLAVGSVLERSLFVARGRAPTAPPAPLVCQAAAAILSGLTPQTKLRAACLGVKIRAEKGLENSLDSLSLFAKTRRRLRTVPTAPEAKPLLHPSSVAIETVTAQTSTVLATSAVGHGDGVSGEGIPSSAGWGSHGRGMGMSSLGGGEGGDGVRIGEDKGQLVLREMPNGLRVWRSSRAEEETLFIFEEVFEDRTYARTGVRVRDGDTVWDVGANVGLTSIFFELETDTPDSVKVYAFEPLPLNFAALKRNLSMHCPTAVVQEYALGATHQDRVPATFYPRMPGNSTLKPLEKERLQGAMKTMAGRSAKGNFFDDAEQVTCDVRTVSWAMAQHGVDRIDLLKIDVEGAELDVLLGVDEQDWPKIRQVVAEVHPVGDRLPRACQLLRDHGFDVSTQALGLDGTPISPSRGVNMAVDAPVAIAGEEGTAVISPATAAGTMPLPREEQSKSHQREDRFNTATKDTDNSPQDRQPTFDGVAGLPASTIGDGREVGEGRSCHLHNVAFDGVVFMVYAKRLPA